jgi:hypothetical protein
MAHIINVTACDPSSVGETNSEDPSDVADLLDERTLDAVREAFPGAVVRLGTLCGSDAEKETVREIRQAVYEAWCEE